MLVSSLPECTDRRLRRRIGIHESAGPGRALEIARAFGVSPARERPAGADLREHIAPWRIVAVVGPSGSGKSTSLGRLRRAQPGAIDVAEVSFPPETALIDAVAPHASLAEALKLLNACGLGEVRLWLRRYEELSEGERFRARLARAVSLAAIRGATIVIDEFAVNLHRRVARCIACNLRRLASREGLSVVIATPHEDVLADLQPDVVATCRGEAVARFAFRKPRCCPPTIWRRLRIERGTRRDYAAFAEMHYRGADELGFVDKVFCLRDGAGGEPVGIVVYAHPPAELALRNQATRGRYTGKLALLNRDVRILRRLIVHPDLRGTGIAHRFVRRTLKLVGTPYVECLAAMGEFNPVFERAGMKRIGLCNRPATASRLLDRLRELDADPFAPDFAVQIGRRPVVRDVVVRLVAEWYEATSGTGAMRADRQTPAQLARLARGLSGAAPVYYLWKSPARPLPRILKMPGAQASISPSTQGSPAGAVCAKRPPGCPCPRLRIVR